MIFIDLPLSLTPAAERRSIGLLIASPSPSLHFAQSPLLSRHDPSPRAGNADALRFLAELILAQVDSDYGCTLDIHPNGAGSR